MSKEQVRIDMQISLEEVMATGVKLFLEGAESSPEKIAHSCVNDALLYMPDYVTDQNGVLTEIHYDKVFNI